MHTGYKVFDAMTHKPIMAQMDDSLKTCAQLMADEHVGAIIIEDAGMYYIATEQDMVRRGVAESMDAATTKISAVMKQMIHSVAPDADIFEALQVMRDANVRHLAVVDDGKMVGLLTGKDILKIQPQII